MTGPRTRPPSDGSMTTSFRSKDLRSIDLSILPALFVRGDVRIDGCARDDIGDDVERQIVERAEADARFPHIELFAGPRETFFQLLLLRRMAVHRHYIELQVVLLCRYREVAQWLSVVRVWTALKCNLIGDRSPVR